MNEAHGVLVAVTGVVAVRLSVTGAYLSYLKEGMRWPLFAAGVVLTVLGGITILRSLRAPDRHDDEDAVVGHEGHGHGPGGPRVGWLLVVPLLAILLVAPAPLGAYAAARDESRVAEVDTSSFGALPPPTDGALDLTLTHFVQRAYYDEDSTMAGVPVRLSGFVVADASVPDGYLLTRFTLSCCAADAFPIQVEVHGVEGPIPPNDTWLEVTGTWIEPPAGTSVGIERGAALRATSAVQIEQPSNPYE